MNKFLLFLALLISVNSFSQEKNIVFTKNRLSQIRKVSYNLNVKNLEETNFKLTQFDTIQPIKDKYNIQYKIKDTISIQALQESTEMSYLNLDGTFKKIDVFFLKLSNPKTYVLKENLKEPNAKKNDFYEMRVLNESSILLLQNIETKKYFVCNNSLLIEYETTKSDDELKSFSDGYANWKTNYVNLTKSAKVNMSNCNAIIKKYSFVNALGKTVYNSSKIPKQDKINFNNNYDKIIEKLEELKKLESERKYLEKFLDNVKENEGLDVYQISLFISKTTKLNIE
ncbi:hypothetical protein C3B47_14055 [Flavobacterium columnare]|uniref:hypothetical protein n=1 Tax=Flavobacterium columnare TaxID=996 RepID=UPI001896619F|nr:hypothetical protein [Flavobacterium columnare]MBF6653978.1 hypothetical protein [Flavobacterium columnare]